MFDFSAGVDAGRVPTIQSALAPNGLKRNQLAWLSNGTVRGGGVTCRTGWAKRFVHATASGLFQGGWLYLPINDGAPYFIFSIGGRIWKVLAESPYTATDLSTAFGLTNPATEPIAHFVQGEEFLVIQAGDYGKTATPTLPLFWDGSTLRRSVGITNTNIATNTNGVNEIPAATCMDYYQGHIWYAQGRTVLAGDVVKGPSGTIAYDYRDSILNVTENPLSFGGDGFTVSTNDGNIRAIEHGANINVPLGESELFVGTRKTIYSMSVPVTRAQWINTTEPIDKVVQITNGPYGDRCIVAVNGDLFYQASDGIRSLKVAVRNFAEWGNIPISSNLERLLQFNDRSLMRSCSGMTFDNRLYQSELPYASPVGTAFKALVTLDFDIMSSLDNQAPPPAWEGMLEGLNFLQLYSGNFGGRERSFGAVYSDTSGKVELWEITNSDRFNNQDVSATSTRTDWYLETPAFTFAKDLELKKLVGGEIWFDKLYGTVELTVEWRPDADPCWQFWHHDSLCSAKSTCEDVTNPVCYPEQPYREGYKWPVTLPIPPYPKCSNQGARPSDIGYQFQVRITLKGWCRIRGIMLYAVPVDRKPYEGLSC
jgi:hypothetical protein